MAYYWITEAQKYIQSSVSAVATARNSIGTVEADTVILEGQFDFGGTTMTELATRTVAAAQRIYGDQTANRVRDTFEPRGII